MFTHANVASCIMLLVADLVWRRPGRESTSSLYGFILFRPGLGMLSYLSCDTYFGRATEDSASTRSDCNWEHFAGACSTGRGMNGDATICTRRQSALVAKAKLWNLRFGHPWRWCCYPCCWVGLEPIAVFLCRFVVLLCLYNFVNSSLTFFSASAVSVPAGMLHLRAVASCWAAANTWDSGEIVGFVMYWCLKNTVFPTFVARVLVTYTQKQRWCSINVPRLKPGSDLVSHDRRLSGLTCAWKAHSIEAKGLHI